MRMGYRDVRVDTIVSRRRDSGTYSGSNGRQYLPMRVGRLNHRSFGRRGDRVPSEFVPVRLRFIWRRAPRLVGAEHLIDDPGQLASCGDARGLPADAFLQSDVILAQRAVRSIPYVARDGRDQCPADPAIGASRDAPMLCLAAGAASTRRQPSIRHQLGRAIKPRER